jgi:hypothetical protein
MPHIDHQNLGDIQKQEYLTGTILNVYGESEDIPEEHWDTADILIDDLGITWPKAPIFYHCDPLAQLQNNGAVMMGAKGFTINDNVILLCTITTAQAGMQLVDNVRVMGHVDGIKQCSYDYVLVRMSTVALAEWDVETLDALPDEYCIIYDVISKDYASIVDPDTIGSDQIEMLEFPCPISKIQSFFRYAELRGKPLFEASFPQGDDEIEIAGATPSWKTDIQGDDIRAGTSAKDWWTSYDVDKNPTIEFFEDLSLGLMLDDEGSSNGTYQRVMDTLANHEAEVLQWGENSGGFESDERVYDVTGSPEVPTSAYSSGPMTVTIGNDESLDSDEESEPVPAKAIGPDGEILPQATSKHIQMAYGEDEVWVCGVNSYDGMIVSYCDAKWKFVRFDGFPPVIPVPGTQENWEAVATDATLGAAMPGGMAANSGKMIHDIDKALASDASLAGLGGENNIFSMGFLKRINEGSFHRTQHPAMSGSQALKISPIPENPEQDPPQYYTAINFKWDKIDCWYRWDNWMNTYGCITSTFGVNPTWWFQSYAQHWGCETEFVETPIGTMWHTSPDWKCMVWMLFGLSTTMMTARQDKALCQQFQSSCKHSRSTVCQLYINQRTSITLWSILENRFVRQDLGVAPYDCVPSLDGEDPVAYAQMPDGSYKHYDLLTEEEISSLLSERIFLRTPMDGEEIPEQESLRLSRNEIEIMGAADLYGELGLEHSRKNPVDQERCPEFEKAVQELAEKVFTEAGIDPTSFTPLFTDMEII